MGFVISELKNLPTDMKWYFFLIGDYRNHSWINDLFRDDFAIIADNIGCDAAIVSQNRLLTKDLLVALHSLVNVGHMIADLETNLPGLLIINNHPLRLCDADKIIYIPFEILENAYKGPNSLIKDIVSFSHDINKDLINKTSIFGRVKSKISPSISLNLGIVAINFDV